MAQPLRVPLRISDCYASTDADVQLFPQCKDFPRNFLTLQEIEQVFANGMITHSRFKYRDIWWRLISSTGPCNRLVYVALLESDTNAIASPTVEKGVSFSGSLSMPLVKYEPSGALSAPGVGKSRSFRAPAEMLERNNFIDYLLTASDSPLPMERYKALIRLMSILKRQLDQLAPHELEDPTSWEHFERKELLQQVVKVGEVLARFGTADFREANNSSRAITAKDYATLLRQYLEAHGFVYAPDFVGTLAQQLQDEASAVRSLLVTRCEANDLIFNQLIKHVGMESGARGSAFTTIVNTPVVNSNATNTNSSNPTNTVHTTSTSAATAKTKQGGLPLWSMAIVAAGLLLKGKFFPGAPSGRGKLQRAREAQADPERKALTLLKNAGSPTLTVERTAARMLSECAAELKKLQQNSELLENDWRLGRLRLATPGTVHPPGYEHVDASACNLEEFYRRLESST